MNNPTFNPRGRLDRLRNRRQGPLATLLEVRANEAFDILREDDAVKYLVGSMQPIDPNYTAATKEEAERVKKHLAEGFAARGISVEFDYQGSVTNDTHILRYSDIDLLSVTTKFHFVENTARVFFPYQGSAATDLKGQHDAAVEIIKSKFHQVTVDVSGGKAIQLSGGSLKRKIDVITAAWWNTIAFDASGDKKDRGIKLFNYQTHGFKENKPFLHNHNIAAKDALTNGNARKAIRMLKTIKADANEEASYSKVSISSYDICAIICSMSDEWLVARSDEELKLASQTQRYIDKLEQNESYRNSLYVPNGTRKIFCADGTSIDDLRTLNRELKLIMEEVDQSMQRTFRTIAGRLNRF